LLSMGFAPRKPIVPQSSYASTVPRTAGWITTTSKWPGPTPHIMSPMPSCIMFTPWRRPGLVFHCR
jgi:hypothetical protein